MCEHDWVKMHTRFARKCSKCDEVRPEQEFRITFADTVCELLEAGLEDRTLTQEQLMSGVGYLVHEMAK